MGSRISAWRSKSKHCRSCSDLSCAKDLTSGKGATGTLLWAGHLSLLQVADSVLCYPHLPKMSQHTQTSKAREKLPENKGLLNKDWWREKGAQAVCRHATPGGEV